MILYWLRCFIRAVIDLFVTPPPAKLARIDVNENCPGCGHRKGKLKAMSVVLEKDPVVAIEHTCQICSVRWYSQTVLATKSIFPTQS